MVRKISHRQSLTLEKEYGVKRAKEIRDRLRKSHLGQKAWNEGLTKETDERSKKSGEKQTKTKLRLFKEGKINPTKYWLGKKQSKEARIKMSESRKGTKVSDKTKELLRVINVGENNPFYGRKHTKEKKKLIGQASKKLWDSEKHREHITNIQKGLWSNPEFKANKIKYLSLSREIRPNKPETTLINIIKKNNLPFNYVGDGRIWFGGKNHIFNPDFLSKNPKHIIEVFGDYWHNLPKVKERDKERLDVYSRYGYKTLIIWEHELKSPSNVIDKIGGFLNE